MKKYYPVILSLAALAFLVAAGFRPGERVTAKIDAPADRRDEKALEHLRQTGADDSLTAAFETARYRIERNGATLSADNPAQRITARFEENGNLRIADASSNRQTVFRLKSLGRGATQTAVGGGIWRTNENRAELRRAESGLTEYFENRADGLEQGFIVDRKPSFEITDSKSRTPLRLVLQTSGGLRAKASADGQKIVLSDASGAPVFNYEKLKVWDSAGKYLTARMSTGGAGEIALEVEDAAAVYPLTIDPIFVQSQKLAAADGAAGDEFGASVAISGNTAVIGAPMKNNVRGAAYVFVRSGAVWTQQAKLTASAAGDYDYFGDSVAISGDTIVVGARGGTVGSNPAQGFAYVFVRSGTNWSVLAKLVAPDGAALDAFGASVAIFNDTVVIGAPHDKIGLNYQQGSVYVYKVGSGALSIPQKISAADGAQMDEFGDSVALQSGTLIIGAPNKIVGSFATGAAYVFTRNGTDWTQEARLTTINAGDGDRFGASVGLSLTLNGPIAVVGAPNDTILGHSDQGSAYVFNRSQFGGWSQTQKLTMSGGEAEDRFGKSVAITPTSASRIYISSASIYRGQAVVFQRENSVWKQTQIIKSTAPNDAYFGNSLALTGATLIVGAKDDAGSAAESGAAYLFNLGTRPFDFDGDGRTDVSRFRPSTGQWSYLRSSDGATQNITLGSGTDRITPADYTGDGKTDISFFRPSSTTWYVLRSEDYTVYSFQFGLANDIPALADYDGDYKADAAVFRASSGTWYILRSTDGGTTIATFGVSGDKPVAADYDGDGKTDIAVFRPGDGSWWYQRSSDGQVLTVQFGLSTDKPVPGDYTGDGKADIAFWRPSTGEWFILRSENATFYSTPFGLPGDLPCPGDYDGDGRFDTAVFRPAEGNWYVNRSTLGNITQLFGLSTDNPVPNAFVP